MILHMFQMYHGESDSWTTFIKTSFWAFLVHIIKNIDRVGRLFINYQVEIVWYRLWYPWTMLKCTVEQNFRLVNCQSNTTVKIRRHFCKVVVILTCLLFWNYSHIIRSCWALYLVSYTLKIVFCICIRPAGLSIKLMSKLETS